jgi:hypothetical protein
MVDTTIFLIFNTQHQNLVQKEKKKNEFEYKLKQYYRNELEIITKKS